MVRGLFSFGKQLIYVLFCPWLRGHGATSLFLDDSLSQTGQGVATRDTHTHTHTETDRQTRHAKPSTSKKASLSPPTRHRNAHLPRTVKTYATSSHHTDIN
uniref:Putative secreted protein n=1 Tax=Anopheles darlingi TaxID=43151 RepID=A0A2M4D935_ANODA